MPRLATLKRALVALAAILPLVTNAAKAAPAPEAALVLAISVSPKDRPALREDLAGAQIKRLQSWRAEGIVKSWRLLFNRYADTGSWDALEVVTFADSASLARWNAIERTSPAGLDVKARALTTAISSTPTDIARQASSSSSSAAGGPVLVIPYDALVPIPEYLTYLDGYTIPQMRGWMDEGVLGGYGMHIARYYAGRPWTALLMLDYRDDAALARREEVVAKVRKTLAADPAWKAFSDTKKAVRSEKQLVVADQIGAEGALK